MTPAARFRSFPGSAPAGGNEVLGIVALDGVISPDGKTNELEILASSNPTLNQAALQWASHVHAMTPAPQNGSTPRSHHVILIFEGFGS
jgi:hypothetical protein